MNHLALPNGEEKHENRRAANSVYMSALNNRTKQLEPLIIHQIKNPDSPEETRRHRPKRYRVSPVCPNGSLSLGNLKRNICENGSKRVIEHDGIVFNTDLPAKHYLSMRSLKPEDSNLSSPMVRSGSAVFSDCPSQISKFQDAMSVRSLASIGMGSTDGRKMVIRRVPTSPNELFSLVNPPT